MSDRCQVFTTTYAGRPLKLEIGKTSALANGSCWVTYGDTTVMAHATASQKPREGVDFLPLSVDYEERLYAVGKIPGCYLKREGKPTEKAVLTSRMVDRPIRPLFPKEMRNDISVIMTVLAVDPDYSPEMAAMIAASAALAVSDIPWSGPIAGVSVGLLDGELVLNPDLEQRQNSSLQLTVAGTKEKIIMIEAGADEVPDELMLEAIELAHGEIQRMAEFLDGVAAAAGKAKFSLPGFPDLDFAVLDSIEEQTGNLIREALTIKDKSQRDSRMGEIAEVLHRALDNDERFTPSMVDDGLYKVQKRIVRNWLLENKRVDGRGMDEIRALSAEVNLVPRVHGSGMFTRGETQVLTIATLGPISDSQRLDGLDEDISKRYMHQYNFPSYSVGETKPSRGPGRREIGHGALAEKALVPVLPTVEEFPYAMRLVSEVLSSNGSTSQGSICGSTLALMDAGVPIKNPVAGISCGLITDKDRWTTMVDIQGLEDFFGDMDFKVGGTVNGITAIQMDLKIHGITMDIIREVFAKTQKGRLDIINNVILKTLAEPRSQVNEFAPKMLQTHIAVDKIREVIGQGGKVIQKIQADCQVKIDVEEDGNVFISGMNLEGVKKARSIVDTIAGGPVIGAIYRGKVVRLMNFGAFVEIVPGMDGLVHVSRLDKERVERVEDFVAVGDEIVVKVLEIDAQGRINLSRKDALLELEARKKARQEQEAQQNT